MEGAHDAPIRMAAPLLILSVGSIFGGWRTKDRMIGVGTPFWGSALFTHPEHRAMVDAEFLPHAIKRLPVRRSITGAVLALFRYESHSALLYAVKTGPVGRRVYVFLNRKWMFDKVYNEFVSQVVRHHGYHTTYKRVDRGRIERRGPEGLSAGARRRAEGIYSRQSGYVTHYAWLMFVGASGRRVRARMGETWGRGGGDRGRGGVRVWAARSRTVWEGGVER